MIAVLVMIFMTMQSYVATESPKSTEGTQGTSSNPSASETYIVTKVVDGDTIDALINGKDTRIRFIGIDTPETVDPRRPVQCFGVEASNHVKELLTGKSVTLETDPSVSNQDKYGRLLRYVILPDGSNLNHRLIAEGYAHEYTYKDTPYTYQNLFKSAELAAQQNKLGLWGDACAE